jgi:nucleotide-binding universal stress UspA family protein
MNDLGENANKLISNATFPVMTCRTVRHPIRFRNLLLPIDLTRNTHEKIDLILRFAREFDCHIHLLAVSEFLEEWTVTKKQLLRRLEDAADHIRKEGLRCSTEVIRHDYVSNSVIEYAEEIKADALVVMAGKQKPFSKLLFGSRTGKVIAGSTIPVISFRHRYSG